MSRVHARNWLSIPFILLAVLLGLAFPVAGHVSAAGFSASWPYKAEQLKAGQIVLVEAATLRSQQARLSLLQKQDGKWNPVLSGIPVTLGRAGIGKTKEGDGKTPSGVYPLGQGFGTANQPEGLKLTYTKTGKLDYWVDDPASGHYNKWVSFAGNPDLQWSSYERLAQPLYKYAIVMRYNDSPVIPGKGSAIFLHLWRGADKPTAGCIAMSEGNLLKLMNLLDPELSPAIAIGLAD